MTTVGKILVFFILIFSVAIGALQILYFAVNYRYYVAYEKLKKTYDASEANAKAYYEGQKATEVKLDAAVKESEALRKQNEGLVNAHAREVQALRDQIKVETAMKNQRDAVAQSSQTEVKATQSDVEEIRKNLKAEQERNLELVKDANKQRERAVSFEIERNALRDRSIQLENQVQEQARDLARMKANVAGGSTTAARDGKNPPPVNVEGLIKATDPSGLVKITIGSDAGLVKGHTLEVFRLNPTAPLQSKYLGTIKLLEVTATEAVGMPVGRMSEKPQVNDQVASRILGT
jgi:hypothetical protein